MNKRKDESILFLVKELVYYYHSARAVGHTHTMLNGLNSNPNALCIVDSLKTAAAIRVEPKQVISLQQIAQFKALRGRKSPITFDNYAVFSLLNRVHSELNRLYEIEHKYEDLKI